jgi:CheY-like chemotaxis protein
MDEMKLLLVEDNIRIRNVMKNIYSSHFEEVIECCDGAEAVLAFNDSRPDWVVMDINLPTGKAGMKEMDGIEATEKIISSHPEAKVIIVSQYSDETTIAAAKNAGAVEFVSKENLSKVIEVIKGESK